MAEETEKLELQKAPESWTQFVRGLWEENAIFRQLLGMCPVLAVTNSAINALAMGLATTFVIVLSNTLVSTLRNFIPKEVRIATFILIIATFVTVVDYLIQALVGLYKENASTLTPDPLYSAFYDSHPPAPVRIAHLNAQT